MLRAACGMLTGFVVYLPAARVRLTLTAYCSPCVMCCNPRPPSVPAYPQITADTLTLLYTVYNTHVYVVVSRLPGPASALRSHTIITTQLRSYHHILFTTGTSERGSARADKFVRLRHGSGVSGHPSTHHLVDTRRFHARPRAI